MGDKKSPTRPKRQPKPSSDEGYWDCSVCTFRNSAEAFKCMMCDVRKGRQHGNRVQFPSWSHSK
uniref:RanBP2-type domain-containing protein n=1 Tax=Anguilla anguilla TaxID=7936 RepID=A0A0E9SIY3_ANGAN